MVSSTKMDMESPRMVAAMKVTGIMEMDLHYGEGAARDDSSSPHIAVKHELMERKRKQLLRELEVTASALDDNDVDAILSPTAREVSERWAAQAAVLREKERIDKQRSHLKMEMRSEVARELEKNRQYEAILKSREEEKKRLQRVHGDKGEIAVKRQEAKAAHDLKLEEKATLAVKQERDRRLEVKKKLADSSDKVTKQLEERSKERSAGHEERSRRMADIASRNMQHAMQEEEEKLHQHEVSVIKDQELQARLEAAAKEKLDKADERRGKFSEKMSAVYDKQCKREQDREKKYVDKLQKLEEGRERGQQFLKGTSDSSREKRDKQVEKYTTNKTALRKELRERIVQIRADIATDNTRSVEVRQKHWDDTFGKSQEFKDIFTEIVQKNKARIERSDECAREQILAKVVATKEKVNGIHDQRRQVLDYRHAAHKDFLFSKSQLDRLKTVVRDASTKRINHILKELDMPLLPVDNAKEGEDTEQKQ